VSVDVKVVVFDGKSDFIESSGPFPILYPRDAYGHVH
jgi:hypothetical protein